MKNLAKWNNISPTWMFRKNKANSLLNHPLGWKLVWGRYNLTRRMGAVLFLWLFFHHALNDLKTPPTTPLAPPPHWLRVLGDLLPLCCANQDFCQISLWHTKNTLENKKHGYQKLMLWNQRQLWISLFVNLPGCLLENVERWTPPAFKSPRSVRRRVSGAQFTSKASEWITSLVSEWCWCWHEGKVVKSVVQNSCLADMQKWEPLLVYKPRIQADLNICYHKKRGSQLHLQVSPKKMGYTESSLENLALASNSVTVRHVPLTAMLQPI